MGDHGDSDIECPLCKGERYWFDLVLSGFCEGKRLCPLCEGAGTITVYISDDCCEGCDECKDGNEVLYNEGFL